MRYRNSNGVIFNTKRAFFMDAIKQKIGHTKIGKKINKHIDELRDGINMAKQAYDEASKVINNVVVHDTNGEFSEVWHQHPESGHYYTEPAIVVEGECKEDDTEDADEDIDGI